MGGTLRKYRKEEIRVCVCVSARGIAICKGAKQVESQQRNLIERATVFWTANTRLVTL